MMEIELNQKEAIAHQNKLRKEAIDRQNESLALISEKEIEDDLDRIAALKLKYHLPFSHIDIRVSNPLYTAQTELEHYLKNLRAKKELGL